MVPGDFRCEEGHVTPVDPRKKHVMLGLDGLSFKEALELVQTLRPRWVKVHDLSFHSGASVIHDALAPYGVEILFDHKLHDSPRSVELCAKELHEAGADAITVHASGGVSMMRAAVQSGVRVFAVTALTTLEDWEVGYISGSGVKKAVLRAAAWAAKAGVFGLVCSPNEVTLLRQFTEYQEMKLLVPGIRSPG